jgi:hypothetical protein
MEPADNVSYKDVRWAPKATAAVLWLRELLQLIQPCQ